MTSRLAEQIRRHAPGTLQSRLTRLEESVSPEQGGSLLQQARLAGDHAAGLATALASIGLADLDKALPKFGLASEHVRKGKTLVFSPTTGEIDKIPVILQPGRSRLHN